MRVTRLIFLAIAFLSIQLMTYLEIINYWLACNKLLAKSNTLVYIHLKHGKVIYPSLEIETF